MGVWGQFETFQTSQMDSAGSVTFSGKLRNLDIRSVLIFSGFCREVCTILKVFELVGRSRNKVSRAAETTSSDGDCAQLVLQTSKVGHVTRELLLNSKADKYLC